MQKDSKKNTKVMYLYRDASNYKIYSEETVSGEVTNAQAEAIKNSLFDENLFYPAQVGLPERKFPDSYEDDPDWFEFLGVAPTCLAPTVKMTIKELTDRFVESGKHWGNKE